jgi:hypothetical protein
MKKFYVTAWVLLTAAAFMLFFNSPVKPVALLIFGYVALALVLAPPLWSVYAQTR